MKRNFLFLLPVLLFGFAHVRAQDESFGTLLRKGKAEFKKDFKSQDYTAAISCLKKAVTLDPENAEAHYFLGYAYSRLNSQDGKTMVSMSLPLTIQSSEEFEQVIQLTPKYSGELVVLDPYAKLTSEWGCMAMCYWNKNKLDSAVWAFNEGRRRGGFSKFHLALSKNILNQCSKNSLLICSGDNLTMPLWYLQLVEGYRKDVAVINVDLLNTTWYPQFLRSKGHVAFDQSQAVLDTMEHIDLEKDSTVWVHNKYAYKDFYWTLKKTEIKDYLLRGDRVFLSILKANEFESDVYFTIDFDEGSRLSLGNYLLPMILLDQLNAGGKEKYGFDTYKTELVKALELVKLVNTNSSNEMSAVESIRNDVLLHLEEQHELKHKPGVKQLLKLLDNYLPESKFPYPSKETRNYVAYIRKQY